MDEECLDLVGTRVGEKKKKKGDGDGVTVRERRCRCWGRRSLIEIHLLILLCIKHKIKFYPSLVIPTPQRG